MKNQFNRILICSLALLLLTTGVLAGTVLPYAEAGFSKMNTHEGTTFNITVNTHVGPLYSVDLTKFVNSTTKNLATAAMHSENKISFVRLTPDKTGIGDCFVYPIDASETATDNLILPHYVYVRYRTTSAQSTGQFFATPHAGPAAGDQVTFSYNNDGEWHLMRVDLSPSATYNYDNFLNCLRFDFFENGNLANYIDIAMIAWFRNDGDAEDYNSKTFGDILKADAATLATPVPNVSYPICTWGMRPFANTAINTGYRFGACIDYINDNKILNPTIAPLNWIGYDNPTYTPITKSITAIVHAENGRPYIALEGWCVLTTGQTEELYWSWGSVADEGGKNHEAFYDGTADDAHKRFKTWYLASDIRYDNNAADLDAIVNTAKGTSMGNFTDFTEAKRETLKNNARFYCKIYLDGIKESVGSNPVIICVTRMPIGGDRPVCFAKLTVTIPDY